MAEMSEDDTNQEAFLLSWDGTTWRDVVRLHQGQVITVGRSATNKLVLHDDACSRNHCEVFHSDGVWQVRDLESRNGTLVNEHPVEGNLKLRPGDVVCIGQCRLAFTTSLDSQPRLPDAGTNVTERETSLSASATPHEEPPILHRSIVPQFLTAEDAPGRQSGHEKELARLYRLGLEMGAAETRQQLTEVVLKSLAAETVADISAVLLARPNAAESVAPADLLVVAYDSRKDLPYRRVSDNLSRVVLSSREAVLARDVEDDQQLAVFDSLGEMRAMSVICAPIHCDDQVRGLVHLYATNPDNALDKHDLEYTLAVARQLALALDHLSERDSLKSGLAQARNVNKSLRQHFDTEFKLIGDSSAMTDLREKIVLIAETHANVLI
ncbi:MAG: FHA domain-containing protein, partial [Fuerstiella sp.]|nr:FHA domain-containing protein [Fuerstiella sp.]